MMMHLKNIVAGNAKTIEQYQLSKVANIVWSYTEEGNNWYEELNKFSPDTLKIAYDKNNIIVDVNTDVTGMNPEGLNVVELPNTTANRRADTSGNWMYQDGQVIKRIYTRDELITQVENEKTRLLAEAATKIAPLQDAVDIGVSTEAEAALLLKWKKYRVKLNRLDTNKAPDIAWPERPDLS